MKRILVTTVLLLGILTSHAQQGYHYQSRFIQLILDSKTFIQQ